MASESKQWAPSRWSPAKVRLFLKHMRDHVAKSYAGDDITTQGLCEAWSTIDSLLKYLALPNEPVARAQAVANITGRPVEVITLKLWDD